jgi:hypothetical protein
MSEPWACPAISRDMHAQSESELTRKLQDSLLISSLKLVLDLSHACSLQNSIGMCLTTSLKRYFQFFNLVNAA